MNPSAPRSLGSVSPLLWAWIRQGEPYPKAARATLRQYRWTQWLFHWNLRLQNRLVPQQPLSQPPVFILGLWRSGTTFLHELMAIHPALCTPRTWQCMAPSTFALTGRPKRSATVVRPMDDFTIDTDSPQEDEFAWLLLGGDSAYRALLDPARLDALGPTLDPAHWTAERAAFAPWTRFLDQVNTLAGADRRLLLKSPNHSFRAPGLLAHFPGAPIVWIARSPADLQRSNLKMWRAMIDHYGLRPPPSLQLERFLERAAAGAAQALHRLRTTLPTSQLILVDFDALRRHPQDVTSAVLRRLGLNVHDLPAAALQAACERRARPSQAAPEQAPGLSEPWTQLAEQQALALATHGLPLG